MDEFDFIDDDQDALAAADLTKKSLVDTRENLGVMLDVMPMGLLIHTEQGILFANREACKLLQSPKEVLTGQHLLDFVRPSDIPNVSAQFSQSFGVTDRTFEQEAVVERTDDTMRLLKLITGRLPWPGTPVIQVLFQDITDQKRAETSLRQLAITDELTGAYNRRQALYEAALYIGSDGSSRIPLSVILIDIDRFKLINDTYGHGIGDVALKELARAAHGFVPTIAGTDSAFFARIGGEEFIILLPGTKEQAAAIVAEQFRKLVEQIKVPTGSGGLQFTISSGVACYRKQDHSFEGVLQRADHALYRAKDNGRNRVELA
ncbi:sensor domain-containing diguanylate cyclase [Devosia sp. SL43]|uniref:sensor domain-containing diguanylate cyclase n=1 Tax=Devosia sp. SL43 TaxID=2806348 RepID=UPI001F425398|nr:sensor domain-containing diguanylate cyclase [Devosia sp. SL43]UJW86791.1 sensor domain-containing diguanylate cyclase [Devosia sp. SL43]